MYKNIIHEDIKNILQNTKINWDLFKNKTILIAGGNSFIAKYIIEVFLHLNDKKKFNVKIISVVRNKKKFIKYFNNKKNIKIIHQDICDSINISNKIDHIFHLASISSPKYYKTHTLDMLKPNVIGTFNLLNLAVKNKVKSFIYFSSGQVYDASNLPLNENSKLDSSGLQISSLYSASKRAGESLCYTFHLQKKVPIKIIRLFHTYGPGMDLNDGRVMMDFISDFIKKKNIKIKSSGNQHRSFCYITDTISAFFQILINGTNGNIYNVGNNKCMISIKSLAKLLAKLSDNIRVEFKKRSKNDNYLTSKLTKVFPDTKKLYKLGWKPQISVKQGFLRSISYYSNILKKN